MDRPDVSIVDRIRANGGEVVRHKWRLRVSRGRLSDAALDWIRLNQQALMREVWPQSDLFEERAAIMEFCGGMDRAQAEEAAYLEVMGHA